MTDGHDAEPRGFMIEYRVAANVRILFVGINPHPGSYRRGVPFSNNKTFWYLLNRAGLLQENIGVSRVDVMHFPIRGPTAIRLRELEELKAASGSG